MIVRTGVTANAPIIDRLRSVDRIRVRINYVIISLGSIRPVFSRKSEPCEAHFQMCEELFLRKVAFQPRPLFSVVIEHQNSRCPESVEAAKVSRIFLDMNMERNKILFDVRRQTGVFIRLFLEPNTGSSTRRRAEIY